MTDALFLVPEVTFTPDHVGAVVPLEGEEGRHAAVVRRISVGERVLLADGQGHALRGEVVMASKRGLEVRAEDFLAEPEGFFEVTAVQALAKGDRGELAVETMTELGIDRIVPWQASRSIVRWSEGERGAKQLSRWQSTAREASKQSRRFRVPTIEQVASTAGVCDLIASVDLALVLHEEAQDWLAAVLRERMAQGAPRSVLTITGPEGGISPEELQTFVAAGAHPVLVARHVLRASTAGVVALAQLQAGMEPTHG